MPARLCVIEEGLLNKTITYKIRRFEMKPKPIHEVIPFIRPSSYGKVKIKKLDNCITKEPNDVVYQNRCKINELVEAYNAL